MTPQRRRVLSLLAAGPAAIALPGWAQTAAPRTEAAAKPLAWPTQPLKVLVGFPAGSTPDLAARAISEALAKNLGQPVVVENRPGASGNIAADLVAKARDDHTIGVLINGNLTVARLLNPKLPFDPAKDFAPLSLIGTAPLLLTVTGSAPGTRPAELLHWVRGLEGKANYGTPGNGTVGHLGMELIKSKTGITAVHVPYPGNPQVINAMLSGQVQLALLPPGLALPHVRSGKLKAIGLTSPGRSALVTDQPTLRDADVTGADLEIWTAAAAPATMPKAVVARLSAALVDAIRAPESRQKLLNVGWQAVGTAPEGLANRMKADTAQLGGIIMMRGIKADS
ncbi:tripartite tricarboxylate transporter substrate binding protein [Aquincola sp. S2]|uniref:Tripartite tricarboxylate transporter substrate binding protein n=1 Tax=Pseudaquabacterium terrae TaxID=2732868 RepID=A0ABX2EUB9_9BURK|nr:tripartite tricarboxylate transporter substrate-binding protein [Aquabacterium terrae]NRF72330.1 tripartite tricarboxylate transporter substrate binding protein [Aquabacterium terrae]